MRLSLRNQIKGVVDGISNGEVVSAVSVRLPGSLVIESIVSRSSVQQLGLAANDEVYALFSVYDTSIFDSATGENVFQGKVSAIQEGDVEDMIEIEVAGGSLVRSCITRTAKSKLGLDQGDDCYVHVPAHSVSLALA